MNKNMTIVAVGPEHNYLNALKRELIISNISLLDEIRLKKIEIEFLHDLNEDDAEVVSDIPYIETDWRYDSNSYKLQLKLKNNGGYHE